MTDMAQLHTPYDKCTYGIMGVKRTVMTQGMQPMILNYLETNLPCIFQNFFCIFRMQ